MKRRTLIRTLSVIALTFCGLTIQSQSINITETDSVQWETLIKAISAVESGNNPKARNGQHVGLLQISPVCVKECNNILGYVKYSLKDRESAQKSIEMFNIIQSRYNPKRDIETAIRIWNGGPGAMRNKKSTNRYYRVVKAKFDKLLDGK